MRDRFRHLLAGLLLMLLALLHAAGSAFADVRPPDGGGIKWSKMKLQMKKVIGTDGSTFEVPEYKYPVPNVPVIAYGYDVEIDPPVTIGGTKITKIKVWWVPPAPPAGIASPPGIHWADMRYTCHGRTFDAGTFSPDGSSVPAILAAGWDEIECLETMEKGHIIVYQDAKGNILHSATANGDGTFTTKNGTQPEQSKAKRTDLDAEYGSPKIPGGRVRCYKPKKR